MHGSVTQLLKSPIVPIVYVLQLPGYIRSLNTSWVYRRTFTDALLCNHIELSMVSLTRLCKMKRNINTSSQEVGLSCSATNAPSQALVVSAQLLSACKMPRLLK